MKIKSVADLEKLYGLVGQSSIVKEIDYISDEYRLLIEAAPFTALATVGPEGLDCSPRGDRAGSLVRVVNQKTLMMPDRRGNNRVDSLKNIIRDPRIALMFLIPGHGNALRVNGQAIVDDDQDLRESFNVDGHTPRSVIIIHIDAVYFQCARAIIRSGLWRSDQSLETKYLPTPGQILESLSLRQIDGHAYDQEWPDRASKTMW